VHVFDARGEPGSVVRAHFLQREALGDAKSDLCVLVLKVVLHLLLGLDFAMSNSWTVSRWRIIWTICQRVIQVIVLLATVMMDAAVDTAPTLLPPKYGPQSRSTP